MSRPVLVYVSVPLSENEYRKLRNESLLTTSGRVYGRLRVKAGMKEQPHGRTKDPEQLTEAEYVQRFPEYGTTRL